MTLACMAVLTVMLGLWNQPPATGFNTKWDLPHCSVGGRNER